MKVSVNTERCKECGLCVHHCPKKALRNGDKLNQAGYRFVVVDDGKCIGCGICYTTCPDGVFHVLG